MIELGRSEKVTALLDSWKEQGETIAAMCRKVASENENLGVKMWNEFLNIRNLLTESHISEAMESMEIMLPQLYDAMGILGGIDVSEGRYRLFSSKAVS